MGSKKVLLVDDSSVTLMMEQMILSRHTDYEVRTARDGQEAVDKATKENPDLILMDVIMPNKNGFEACKELRTNQATRHTPIILVTTRSEEEYVEKGFSSGCNDYINKPINSKELLALLRSYLGS